MGVRFNAISRYGAQDVFLTGNPQITFFKVVYRRHTNFSKECIVQDFTGGSFPATASTDLSYTLSRNGDLVQEIYLKSTIAQNDVVYNITTTIKGTAPAVTAANTFILTGLKAEVQ